MICESSVSLFALLTARYSSTMASADFSRQLLAVFLNTSVRSPEVRRVTFFPYIGIIYTNVFRSVYWTLSCYADLSYISCLMMFVFLRPEICRRLPSDSTSRWTPLPLANGWQLIAPITDLHRQIYSPCSAHIKKRNMSSYSFL